MFNVGELGATINADRRPFDRTLDSVFRDGGRRMQQLGTQMTMALSAPLAAAAGLSVKAAADYESAFANVRKTVDTTEDQFQEISTSLRDLSKEIPTSAEELANMAGVAGQLGIEAQNITQFTKTIAMLGDTTDIAGEQAALSLSRFMNVMGTASSDIDRLGSTIVGLGNNFAAMESEIVAISQSLAPLGNMIGLTEQQVLAFSTTIAASGGNAEAAATSFQRIASTMKTAVLSGNEDLETFAETANMTADEFKQAFERDSAEALTAFLKGLRRIQKSGGNTAAILEEMSLADQRLQRELGKVIGNLDQLDEAIALSNEEWERATALTNEAEKRYSTLTSQFGILKNTVLDLGREIGASLVETFDIKQLVQEFSASINNAIDSFKALPQETRRMAFQVAGLLGASGPIIAALGTLSVALSAISWPVVLGVTAFAGAVTAIVQNWDHLVEYFTNGTGAKILQTISDNTKRFVDAVSRMWKVFGSNIVSILKGTFTTAVNLVGASLEGLSVVLDIWSGRWLTDWNAFLDDTESSFEDTFGSDGYLTSIATSWWERFLQNDPIANAGNWVSTVLGLDGAMQQASQEAQQQSQQTADSIGSIWQGLSNRLSSMDFSFSVSGAEGMDEGQDFGTNIAKATIPNPLEGTDQEFMDSLANMKASGAQFSNATDAALQGTGSAFDNFVARSKEAGFDFVSFMSTQVAGAISSFSENIGKMFAGTGDEFATGLEKILLIVTDFASQLADLLIGIGSAIAIVPGLQGNAAAFIAGGAALKALASGVKAGINKRIENREQRAQEENGADGFRANGGSVFAGGSYIVGENGREMFTPSTNGTVQPMKSKSSSLSPAQMKSAFQQAFRAEVQRLSPNDIFAMSQKGRRGF